MDGDFDPEAFISGSDTTSTDTVDPYKQALTQKILSGATDYTYGPGSPGATPADMRQKTGSRDNQLQTGDVALPEKDYNLFTPKEREQLGIADTSWIKEGQPTPRGSVERYFGTDAQGFDPEAFIKNKPQPLPTPTQTPSAVPNINQFLEPAPPEDQTPPATGDTETDTQKAAKALGKGIEGAAKAIGNVPSSLNLPHVAISQPFQIPTAGQLPAPPIQIQPMPQPRQQDMSAQMPVLQQLLPQPQQIPLQQLPQPIPQPMPTPVSTPYNPRPIPGDFMHNLGVLSSDTVNELSQMINAPVQLSQQALNPNLGVPQRLAAAAGVVASAAQLDPLLPHAAASKEIPGAFAGAELPPAGRQIAIPSRPQPQLTEPSQLPPLEVTTQDGFKFKKQPDGSWGNGDMSWGSFDEMTKGLKNDGIPYVTNRVPHQMSRYEYADEMMMRDQMDKSGAAFQDFVEQGAPQDELPPSLGSTIKSSSREAYLKAHDELMMNRAQRGQSTKQPPAATPQPRSTPPSKQQQINAALASHPIQQMKSGGIGKSTQPPSPPKQPPPAPPASKPSYSTSLNPVSDWGPFTKTYKIDKELGERMDALGAAPETGALMAETQSRNMLHELTPQQEADLGKLLLSDRLKRVNPNHPQVIFDSVARGIESDPAIKKALDYYRKEVEPELEEIGKKAGLQEGAAATQRGKYFTLSPERLPDGTVPELAPRFGQTSRTTKYALPAEGMAAKYSTDIRDVLRQSYTERIRKAAARELFDAAHAKGVVEKTPKFVPDPENGPNAGKWVNEIKEGNLPEGMRHDLNLIAAGKSSMQPEGIQKLLQSYQRGATAVQLGLNPLEIQNHLRRQLHVVAAKPPIGQGVMARLSAVVPYFGPKIWAMKRAMSDMSTPARQQILKDITSQGGGSSRAFREKYGTQLPVLKHVSEFTNKLLFGYPTGKGVMGFDLRMRTLLEEIRRNAEPHLANDKQRMRQFANQLGQYGTMASWPVRALRHINPYAATTLPMRWAELRTLVGGSGLRSQSIPEALMRRAETFVRGTGGTIAMLTIANKLLSGNWPWQNKAGHEFDLKTGVKDKQGNDIYVPNRFLSPEMYRALSTYSVPPLLAEHGAPGRGALSETAAASLGPINAGLSLINSPALGITAAAIPQWALHAEKWPGEKSVSLMKVGQYTNKDRASGVPPMLKRAEGVAEQIHPALASILGYMEEPIKGLAPLGVVKVDRSGGGGGSSSHVSRSSGRGSGGRGSGRGRGGR